MILTVTLNPSMDAIYFTERFVLGEMNRCGTPLKAVGGKGINAGRTAAILGSSVKTFGVLAGLNGQFIQQQLQNEPFQQHFLQIPGESRNAITIMDQAQNQTEIVESGPKITAAIAKDLLHAVLEESRANPLVTTIALCGSANTDNPFFYRDYLLQLDQQLARPIYFLADLSGEQLENALKGSVKPFFIKPNIHEFSALIQTPIQTKKEALRQLRHPLLADVPFVLVSCGSDGAVARYHDRFFTLTIPSILPINPTGSGDATVGGVAYALDQHLPIEETLRYAMACGISNALEEKVGFVTSENVALLKEQIIIEEHVSL